MPQRYEQVNILESGRALALVLLRAAVAALAAGAGALGTAAAGGNGIEPAQVWVAIGAGAAAFGAVVGVPGSEAKTNAPMGEVEKMRRHPETTQLQAVPAPPGTRRNRHRGNPGQNGDTGYEPV